MRRKIYLLTTILIVSTLLLACNEKDVEDVEIVEDVEGNSESEEQEEVVESDAVAFGSFESVTTEGEAISNEVFADYDLTMVNIWATWCSPCINEMSELQEVYEGLAENVNLISICYDSNTDLETAIEVMELKGIEFVAIVNNDDVTNNIMSTIRAFPTTIFVDRDGNIVGDYIEGAPSSNVVEVYNGVIAERLELVEIQ